jgi:hypothetical protein
MKLFELDFGGMRRPADERDPMSPEYQGHEVENKSHTVNSKVQYEVNGQTCVLHSVVTIAMEPAGMGRQDVRKINSIKVTGVEFQGGQMMTPEEVVAKFGPESLVPAEVQEAVENSLDM